MSPTLDARVTDGALVRFPAGSLEEIEVKTGQVCQLAPHLYTARNVDLEAGVLEGTWRGTMDDHELLTALEVVYECRGDLEAQARRGFAIEKQFWSILRNTTRDEVLNVVRTFEEGGLPDGADSLHENIDTVLEEHGLEDQIKTDADDFDLADELRHRDGDGESDTGDPRQNGADHE